MAGVGLVVAELIVQVRACWGDYAVGTWFLPIDRAFVVGDAPNVDCAVELDPGQPRTVSLRLDPLRAASGAEMRWRIGALDVSLRALPAAPPCRTGWPDRREFGTFAALVLAIGGLVSSSTAASGRTSLPPGDAVRVEQRWIVRAPVPSSTPERPPELGERAPAASEGDSQGEVNRCERVPGGANGAPDGLRVAAFTVAGPPDNPDPHIARETGRQVDVQQSVHGSDPAAAPRTLSRAWGRNEALGHDERHARGSAFAAPAAEGWGNDAPGWSGRCQGCGAGGLVPVVVERRSDPGCAVAIGLGGRHVPR